MKPSSRSLNATFRHLYSMQEDERLRFQRRSSAVDDLIYLALTFRANGVRDVIEVGTFLGQSACFLAPAISGKFYTININPREVAMARENVARFGVRNVELIRGDSLEVLPQLAHRVAPRLDVVYIDGLHSYHASMSEFRIVEPFISTQERAAVFFDDANKMHPDGEDDGGVIRTVQEVNAEPIDVLGGRVAVKRYGDFKIL